MEAWTTHPVLLSTDSASESLRILRSILQLPLTEEIKSTAFKVYSHLIYTAADSLPLAKELTDSII